MLLFRALRHREFALLWSGQTISSLGDSLYRVALAWWVLQKTGSAVAMGTVFIFSSVPMLLFLLVGGVAVDRFPRLRLMLGSDLARGLVVGTVALLAFTQLLEIWHVYIASIVFGFVDAFFQPAYMAAVPEVTPPEVLPSANSLTGLSRQVSGVVGPALGAGIVSLGGTPIAFAFNSLSFFLSAACLLPIVGLSVSAVPKAKSSNILLDLREGLAAVLASPWLWITIAIAALANITAAGPFQVALPFLIKENLQADVGWLGLIYTLSSLGSVVGSVWLGRAKQLRQRGLTTYVAWIVAGLMITAIGLPITLVGVGLAAFGFGLCIAIFGLIWTNTLQEFVPRELLGRVSSIDYLGSFVLFPIGYGVAGWATDQLGAPLVFIGGGLTTMLLAALGLVHPAIRRLD